MLIETLQWLRYPMNIIHILQSWRNWAVKLLDWTAVLRSTIEIPIRVLINGLSSFSTYHPNIICNSRWQLFKHQSDILLSFQTLYVIVSMFGQAILDKYEASNCQQLFNLLHWNVMTNHKNDNIAQLFYSLPLSVLKSYEIFHHLIATSSCFSFFPSPYFLSFCCCCVYPNIKKI